MMLSKNNLKFIVILSLIFCIDIAYAQTSPADEDYLWLDFSGSNRHTDAGGAYQFIVRYGKPPDLKKDVSALTEMKAFCTFGRKDKSGKDIFYKLDVQNKNGDYLICVDRPSETWCMVLLRARKKYKGLEYHYTARLPFFIFAKKRAFYKKLEETKIPDRIYDPFDITIYRQSIKEELTYNRKRLFPIRATVKFSGKPWGEEIVEVINDRGESLSMRTDKNGDFAYFPRYFKKFRSQGASDYGEDLLLVRKTLGDIVYADTYTILFDSLPMQERRINLTLGLSLFILSFVITWIYLWLKGRSITHETS